jgi:hypothetical protein
MEPDERGMNSSGIFLSFTVNRRSMMNEDSDAKTVGKVAAGGTVGGIGVAASGASAAAITQALAAAGSIVGGGMATGVAVVAAAPLVVGGLAYGLYKWLKD